MKKNVLMIGASGMIGSLILQKCLNAEAVENVLCAVRRPSNIHHPKLKEVIVEDFLKLDDLKSYFGKIDTIFYCSGVYTGQVNRREFRKITVDYPAALADAFKANRQNVRFCFLSGAGADRKRKSRMMFANDKGEIENYLSNAEFNAFHSFRPSYIYPVSPRKEPNLSYKLIRLMYPIIKHMGNKASVQSTSLATAMFNIGIYGGNKEIYENIDIVNFVPVHTY